MMRTAYLSLGTNLGDRARLLRSALELLSRREGIALRKVSSFYETEPWGRRDQPEFLNAAAEIRTRLSPLGLLDATQAVEQELGRERTSHWGPRTMDIDILLLEGIRMQSERLTLPHPYWKERRFVLLPLSEIAGDMTAEGRTVDEVLSVCKDGGNIRKALGSPMDFDLRLLTCVDRNWGLGKDGRLLFRFPEDMRRFRTATLGHTVILGRKTLQSFPGGTPLEGRRHLVLTGTLGIEDASCGAEFSVELLPNLEALWESLSPGEENFVIGGGEVYRELLPYCREALVTFVRAEKPADCFLEDLDARRDFLLREAEPFTDPTSGIAMEFRRYGRNF